WADAVFCLTRMSLAHTAERLEANRKGTRFLSLPDYSLQLLGGVSLTFDFTAAVPEARRLGAALEGATQIRVWSEHGTDVTFTVAGRRANICPGLCLEPGTLGSPPDAEVNIAPIEETANGVVCVDGSIPCREIGLLTSPVMVKLQRGAVVGCDGPKEVTA